MAINSNGVATATGKQLLQIIPINIVTILAVLSAAVGLYLKFNERITLLEQSVAPGDTLKRVSSLESKMDNLAPTIVRTDTNVQWLMKKQGLEIPK